MYRPVGWPNGFHQLKPRKGQKGPVCFTPERRSPLVPQTLSDSRIVAAERPGGYIKDGVLKDKLSILPTTPPLNTMTTFSALFALLALAVWSTQAATYTGCGAKGFSLDVNGRITRKLPSGRQYLLHVPKEYGTNTATPLVLSFHGG
jgi:hypothetical protein